jgi:hypothetical protein
MCCLLLRIEDRNPGKPGAYTAGDVVCVLPDEHRFSPAEVSGGVLRAVRILGISPDSMRSYLFSNENTRRSQGFDLNGALGGLLRASTDVVNLTRTQAWDMLNLSRERK